MEEFKVLGILIITAEVVQGIDGKHLAPHGHLLFKNAVINSADIRNMLPSLLLSMYFMFENYDWKPIFQ